MTVSAVSSYSQTKDIGDLNIKEETTGGRGVFEVPATAANSVFVTDSVEIGYDSDLGLAIDRVCGSRDPSAVSATLEAIRFSLAFPCVYPNDTIAFLKRGFNLEAGTGTIEWSFSLCLPMKLGTTQYYLKMKNCVIGAGTLGLMGSGPWTASCWIMGNIHAFDTVAPVNWTLQSAPTYGTWAGTAITGRATGANPVIIRDVAAAVNYTPSVRGVTIAFNNGLFPIPEAGLSAYADYIPLSRSLAVALSLNFKDDNVFALHRSAKEVNTYITILTSGSHSFVGSGGKISPLQIPTTQSTPLVMAISHAIQAGVLA